MEGNCLSLEEIKDIQLSIMQSIDAFCRKNNLRYSLGGGSLLGAIRHKGYIPWDDDIDIMMPRNDYDFFVNNYNQFNNNLYKCHAFENDKLYKYPFAKISDDSTIMKESDLTQLIGVNIDLFPIDGYPSDELKRKKFIKKLLFLRHIIYAYIQPVRKSNGVIKNVFLIFMNCFVPNKIVQKKIKKFLTSNKFDESDYVGAVIGSYPDKECHEKYVFDDYIELDFEGNKFLGIKEYDIYLKQHYGDYMKLPPKECQIRAHNTVAYKR